MIRLIKICFCVFITALAVVSCRTFFEGEKLKFSTDPCFNQRFPRVPADSTKFRPFGY